MRGRPCKDAAGWHTLPVPPPPPPLPDYGASASALAMVAPSSPLFPVIAPTSPGEGRGASVPAGQAVCAAAQSSAAPPSTLVAARARTAPPAVPQKRSRPDFGSDAEHEAFKQDRRKAQKRVQEYGRAVRDRSARARPAEQRQQRAKQQAREEAREEAAARKAAAAPQAARLSILDRAPKRAAWQRVSGPRADGRRVVRS